MLVWKRCDREKEMIESGRSRKLKTVKVRDRTDEQTMEGSR